MKYYEVTTCHGSILISANDFRYRCEEKMLIFIGQEADEVKIIALFKNWDFFIELSEEDFVEKYDE